MENVSHPIPPNLSEGCFNCGGGKNEILQSFLRNSASVALCGDCASKSQNLIDTQPFNARGGNRALHVT